MSFISINRKFVVGAVAVLLIAGCGGGGGGTTDVGTGDTGTGGGDEPPAYETMCPVTDEYLASLQDETSTEDESLAALNEYRAKVSLPELGKVVELHMGAKAHANYLRVNTDEWAHEEILGHDLCFAEYPWERDVRAGYNNWITWENFAAPLGTAGVDQLMSAIYHRFAILNFSVNTVGVGDSNRTVQVQNFGNAEVAQLCAEAMEGNTTASNPVYGICSDPDAGIDQDAFVAALDTTGGDVDAVMWPPQDYNETPAVFYGEIPDPIPDRNYTGYPVSVNFNPVTQDCDTILSGLEEFSLADNNGSTVEAQVVMTRDNDPNYHFSSCEYAFFPKERLMFGHTYTATFKSGGVNYVWSFQTPTLPGTGIRVNLGEHISVDANGESTFYIVVYPTDQIPRTVDSFSWSSSNVTVTDWSRVDGNTITFQVDDPNVDGSVTFSFIGDTQVTVDFTAP